MRTAITKSILMLGRYAVLPVIAIAFAIFMAWLIAFDRYPLHALFALPVVFPVVTGAVALGVGLLLPIRRDVKGRAVDERSAPGLWAAWNEFDRTSPRSSRTLLIDVEINASIGERRQYFGLLHRRITMTTGLALLIVLDERAVRAVVAHEVAHARLQHTTGGANLLEFTIAAHNLFDYADPDTTISGALAYWLLQSLLVWIDKEYLVLSRRNELAADREASGHVGREDMARALVLLDACSAGIKELVRDPLDKELLGAIRAPKPPLQRVLDQLDAIRAPERIEALASAEASEEESKSTHPHLRTRLANLGFSETPRIDAARTSAADSLLSKDGLNELLTRFDREWCDKANKAVGIY